MLKSIKIFGLAVLVFLFLVQMGISANLVINGGFETGDFTGWTVTGWDITVASQDKHTGSYAARFASLIPDDTIEQTLSTVAGQAYTIEFWLKSLNLDFPFIEPSNHFSASWNETTLLDIYNRTFNYLNFSYSVTGTGSDEIKFAGYDYWSSFHLDDVSVTAPIPGSLVLLGSGLIPLIGIGRRKLNWLHATAALHQVRGQIQTTWFRIRREK